MRLDKELRLARERGKLPVAGQGTYAWLRALGDAQPPERLALAGRVYRRATVLKHDFFAATALYQESAGGKVVLKLGRTQDLLGCPLDWLGRWLTRRELAMYAALQDLPAVPALLGPWGPNGFVHVYVEGHPLRPGERVGDNFFEALRALVDELHGRHMAYVDLEKRENILVGDDGRPYLIDFQISLHLTGWWARRGAARSVLGLFQRGDRYHLLKHKRRHRPELMTEQEWTAAGRRGVALTLHRWLASPLTAIRRWALRRLQRCRAPKRAPEAL